jgi:hypothetical protein
MGNLPALNEQLLAAKIAHDQVATALGLSEDDRQELLC